jgi:hypothetical protein
MTGFDQVSDEMLRPALDALPDFGERADHPLLTFLGTDGFPFSARVTARQIDDRTFAVTVPAAARPATGGAVPASLLWHTHDEVLENLASVLLRGLLTVTDEGDASFRITRPPALSGVGSPDWAAMFASFERNAEGYLRDYGLTPPDIDWSAYEALVAEVQDQARQ